MEEELPFRTAPRKRWFRLATVTAVAVVLLIAARFGMRAWNEHHAKVALASVHQCLFGPPLEPNEHPSGRLHRIALSEPPADWPARCDPYARDFLETRRKLPDYDPLAIELYTPEHVDLANIESYPFNFDAFFELTAPRPTEKAPSDVPVAPPVKKIPDERTHALVPLGELIGASSDPVPAADAHVLLSGPRLCTARAPLEKMECARLPSEIPRGAHLWPGSEPGGPVLVASPTWWSAGELEPIVRVDTGERFCTTDKRTCTAFGLADGEVVFVSRAATTIGETTREHYFAGRGSKGDAPLADLKLDLSSEVDVQIFGARLFHLQSHEPGHWRLMSRTIGPPLGPPEDLGEVPHAWHLHACYTRSALVVHGEGFAAFVKRGAPAVMHRFTFPKSESVDDERIIGCGADDFHITETANKGSRVRSLRCTETGCGSIEELDVDAMLSREANEKKPIKIHQDVHATRMGEKLLVLWRSSWRGVRFRVATVKDIASARDQVLYDDRISDGAPFSMSQLLDTTLLLPRHDATLFFVETMGLTRGIKGFRIAPDGTFATLE